MLPRVDPQTVPVPVTLQLARRPELDRYGADRSPTYAAKSMRTRALETRNGMPWKPYRYRGTGESMSQREAAWWLTSER